MTRQLDSCPDCRHAVLRVLDADMCAVCVTLHPHATTRAAALAAIAAGRRAVTRETHKRERGGTVTRYYAFDTPERIRSEYARQHPYYVEHECGTSPPTETPNPNKQETESRNGETQQCPF